MGYQEKIQFQDEEEDQCRAAEKCYLSVEQTVLFYHHLIFSSHQKEFANTKMVLNTVECVEFLGRDLSRVNCSVMHEPVISILYKNRFQMSGYSVKLFLQARNLFLCLLCVQ